MKKKKKEKLWKKKNKRPFFPFKKIKGVFRIDEEVLDLLFSSALKARLAAYAPYSQFKVGAALLSSQGKIYSGCNVENASFALSCCAEKVAVVKAVSEGERDFKAILIVADSQKPIPPCGSCRQVLYEFSPALTVIAANLKGEKNIFSLKNLLPEAFIFGK